MPFTPVTYNTGAAPGIDGPAVNAWQLQYEAAINAFERDLFTPFVFSGLVATRDGTTLSQLDVTAGVAFLIQSDGQSELYRVAPIASTQSATGNANATMYLDLNPDGSWSWGTAHSGVANYLTICTVTTDASANIATVTDTRVLTTTLLSGMSGGVGITSLIYGAGVSGSKSVITWDGANGQNVYWTPQAGAGALGHTFVTWNGAAQVDVFSIGGRFGAALSYVDDSGNLNYGGGSGGFFSLLAWDGTNQQNTYWTPQTGAAKAHTFVSWNGSAAVVPFSIGGHFGGAVAWVDNSGNYSGPAGGGIPTTRNGAALSVPIYTGTTTPVNPPTGSIWIKA